MAPLQLLWGSSPTIIGLLSNRWWEDEEGLAGCGLLLPPGHLTWLCRLPITPTQTRVTLYAANNQINQDHPNRYSNHVQEFWTIFGFQHFTFQKQVGWVTRRGHPLLLIIVTWSTLLGRPLLPRHLLQYTATRYPTQVPTSSKMQMLVRSLFLLGFPFWVISKSAHFNGHLLLCAM